MNKLRQVFFLSLFAIAGKLVALLRQSLLITVIGLGEKSDIYLTSFRIPDLLFNLLVYGTLLPAFIPVFTEVLLTDKQKARVLASSILTYGILFVGIGCLFALVFSRSLLHLTVPGFPSTMFEETLKLTRILLLSPLIFTVSTILTGILQSSKKFVITQAAPILYNLGIIFGLYVFYPLYGLVGLAYGVLLGALGHLLMQVPFVLKEHLWFASRLDLTSVQVKKIGTLFLPRLIGIDPGQISLLIASFFGSIGLPAGSISAFTLATDLIQAPVAVFAYAASVVALPLLSETFAQKKYSEFIGSLRMSIKNVLYFLIPASFYMLLYRAQIVRIIFGRNNFSWQNTETLLQPLGIMSFAIIAFGLIPVFSRAFYAKHNTKKPVIFSLVSIALNFILAWPLSKLYGINGLALAFSISLWVNALLLIFSMRASLLRLHRHEEIFDRDLFTYIIKTLVVSLVSACAAYSLLYASVLFFDLRTAVGLIAQLALSFAPSALLYVYVVKKWAGIDVFAQK